MKLLATVRSLNISTIRIDIKCLSNLTYYEPSFVKYINLVLCKWVYNGTDYYDSYETAYHDCYHFNHSFIGYNNAYIQSSSFALIQSYFDLARCGK